MSKYVLIIGATGTIGSAVRSELARDHTVISASRTSDEAIDLADVDSISSAIERVANSVGQLESIVVCAGGGMIGKIDEFDMDAFLSRMQAKLLGQVAVVRYGYRHVRPGGAIVLTSGTLEKNPQPGMSHLAVMNAAIAGFVRSAAVEIDSVRICAVSPGLVNESPKNVRDLFEGMTCIAAGELALIYREAMENGKSGVTYDAFGK